MAVELAGREMVAGDMRKMKRPGKCGQSHSNTERGREGGRQEVRRKGERETVDNSIAPCGWKHARMQCVRERQELHRDVS